MNMLTRKPMTYEKFQAQDSGISWYCIYERIMIVLIFEKIQVKQKQN